MRKTSYKNPNKINPSLLLIMFKRLLIGWLSQKDTSSKESKKLISLKPFQRMKKGQNLTNFLTSNLTVLRKDHPFKQANNINNQLMIIKKIKWKKFKNNYKISPICLQKNRPYKRLKTKVLFRHKSKRMLSKITKKNMNNSSIIHPKSKIAKRIHFKPQNLSIIIYFLINQRNLKS